MATDVYQGTTKIGWVSTAGEVYRDSGKVGWVLGNGDIYRTGILVGWVTRAGTVIDMQAYKVGRVDSSGDVYRGTVLVGRVDCISNRYYIAGAALLLLLCEDWRTDRGAAENSPQEVLQERAAVR
jgi:hypothetical protein